MAQEGRYDAVVIGSGLGGLTAGALLARNGHRVALIERNYGLGGAASCYRVGRLTIEASLHETADPHDPRDLKHAILSRLGLLDQIEWVPIPALHTVSGGPVGEPFTIDHGFHVIAEQMSQRFPASSRGINKFLCRMERIYDATGALSAASESRSLMALTGAAAKALPIARDWRLSLAEAMARDLGDDEGAKCVLGANLAYYADDPRRLWWILFATAQSGYFGSGGVYVRGGSTLLSRALAKSIKQSGGDVFIGRTAQTIEFDGTGRPIAVHHTARNGNGPDRLATRVVLACCAPTSVAGMLPEDQAAAFLAPYRNIPLSISLFTAHFGLRCPPQQFGLHAYSTILLPDWMTALNHYADAAALLSDAPAGRLPPLTIVNYGAINSGLDEGGLTLVTVAGADRLENWRNGSSQDYESRRAAWLDAITACLEDRYPGFAGAIAERTFLTAHSMSQYLGTPGGAIYGFAPEPPARSIRHGLERSPRTPIPGLFLASSFAGAGGFTGAMGAGASAAKIAAADLKA